MLDVGDPMDHSKIFHLSSDHLDNEDDADEQDGYMHSSFDHSFPLPNYSHRIYSFAVVVADDDDVAVVDDDDVAAAAVVVVAVEMLAEMLASYSDLAFVVEVIVDQDLLLPMRYLDCHYSIAYWFRHCTENMTVDRHSLEVSNEHCENYDLLQMNDMLLKVFLLTKKKCLSTGAFRTFQLIVTRFTFRFSWSDMYTTSKSTTVNRSFTYKSMIYPLIK